MGLFDNEAQQRFLKEEQHLEESAEHRQVTVKLPRESQPDVPLGPSRTDEHNQQADTEAASKRAHVGKRDEQRQDVVLRIATPIHTALQRAREAQNSTYTDVVLDAVDACWSELDEILPPAPERNSPLPPRRRYHRTDVGPTTQVHLLLTDRERQVLERVVDTTGVGSLTDLIERVLRHHLDLHEQPQ